MDEQPKSIWKKHFTGRAALIIWLAVAAIALILGTFIASLADYCYPMSNWAAAIAIFGGLCFAGIGLVLYVVWPLLRWLFWKHWRRTLFGFACFATLIALFYAEEDWRGKHDWEKFKNEWEAKGEKFDYKDFIPPPVPDEQNFALTEIMFSTYGDLLTRDGKVIPLEQRLTRNQDTNAIARLSRLNFDLGDQNIKAGGFGYWLKGTTINLKVWQDNYRALAAKTNLFVVPPQPQSPAADVLLAVSKYDATVEGLRQASQLPYSRFPLNYDIERPFDTFLPHLAKIKGITQLLRLRALAELQNGQSEIALADVKLTLRLVEAIHAETFLISQLVRFAMTDIVLQPIYEGLAEHRWSDAQLVALDTELARLDFLADCQLSLRSERAATCAVIDYLGKKQSYQRYRDLFRSMGVNEDATYSGQLLNKAKAVGIYLMPAGWFEQNKLFIARGQQGWITGDIFPENHIVSPQKYRVVDQSQSGFFSQSAKPWNFLAKEFLAALGAAGKKASRLQISVDLARTAIALERYRLAHGEFPASLDTLAPQFIAAVPHDVIGGQPLHYRRTSDGQFILYSIGWNETDDGGVRVIPKGSSLPKFEEGDWVWRYPAKVE
jgi:hypothetical protein